MIKQPTVLATSTGSNNQVTNDTGQVAYVSSGPGTGTLGHTYVNGSSVSTAAAYMATLQPGDKISLGYSGGTVVWYWSPYTPAVPATTVPVANTTGKNLAVAFPGAGTVTVIHVNGVTTNVQQDASLPVALPPGAAIDMTYSAAPVWAWLDPLDLSLANSNGTVYAQPNTVAPTGAAGYSPLNTLPYAAHAEGGLAGWGVGISN